MKKLFLILLLSVCVVSYAKAEEQALLPSCNDEVLLNKLSDKIKSSYDTKFVEDDLYSKRQRKLFLKNLKNLEEVDITKINRSNFDFYSKYTELKVNKNISVENIKVCNLKNNKRLENIYLFIYSYKNDVYLDFVNFKVSAYKKLENMKL